MGLLLSHKNDFRALTPLFHGHINPYGRFALDLAHLRVFERRV
jgi:hypothetical protein